MFLANSLSYECVKLCFDRCVNNKNNNYIIYVYIYPYILCVWVTPLEH